MPIPSLLAVAAVHHHLVREGTRLRAGIILESGEPREVHHFATLIGYGASAINPYLMLETLDELVLNQRAINRPGADGGEVAIGAARRPQNVVKAIGKGLLKTISKMGISTIQSYCGAQIFEAVGLERELIDAALHRHRLAHRRRRHRGARRGGARAPRARLSGAARRAAAGRRRLRVAARRRAPHVEPRDDRARAARGALGQRRRRRGARRRRAGARGRARQRAYEKYREYAQTINEDAARKATLRGLLKIGLTRGRGGTGAEAIPLEQVEPASEIVKRFCTGAMSLGSISREAHETLAIAMNRLGGRSNTGEGGEDPARFTPDANGDRRRSAIKQVASGRFGVTIHYLVNADELQIKMAQGAKPGEGGQLPGHKVDAYIGSIRHTTPGVGLISPPPHHDIYSIEDLKQLIYDLRCANPKAQVSVKLVSEVGVGTVAAGVSKANADRVLIAGHDGGTGASPLSSIQSAGDPLGDRPRRDPADAAAERPALAHHGADRRPAEDRSRRRHRGDARRRRDGLLDRPADRDRLHHDARLPPEHLPGRHRHPGPGAAQALQGHARARRQLLLLRRRGSARDPRLARHAPLDEAIGRVDLLSVREAIDHWKARGVDLTHLLTHIELPPDAPRHQVEPPPAVLEDALDWELIERAEPALRERSGASIADGRVHLQLPIRNRNRCVGGILSSHIARERGAEGLPEDSIVVDFDGSAGQSFGGWLAPGVTFTLDGDANDYAGKGLSGGIIAVRPRAGMGEHFEAEQNVIVGNTVLYGATGGRAFFRGLAGERFAVRNSGASAVVEGVGDHGCEYMTGGRVVVLGPTGRNFAAGMSGGVAYVLDEAGDFAARCNMGLVGFECPVGADASELRALIDEHSRRTGSPVAARVLASFEELLAKGAFVKVMPHDYKRVLAEQAAQAEPTSRRRFRPDGQARRLPADRASRRPAARSRSSARTTTASSCSRDRCPSCATRARAAWTAACRSATTAARSAT